MIDLHVHSTESDGTFTPVELVRHAAKKNVSVFALTDHDTISGVEDALIETEILRKKGIFIRVIPGVEISAEYKNRDIHILGLFIDHKCPQMNQLLKNARTARDLRNEEMASRLRASGIDIQIEQLQNGGHNASITRSHFAQFLTAHGYTENNEQAFKKYLGYNTPYYVSRKYMKPRDAILAIHTAGGIAILAHPLLYKLNLKELEALLIQLKSEGLEGIEVFYASNISNDEATLRNLSRKFDFLVSGGTDFHGKNKPQLEIGIGKGNFQMPDWVLPNLEQRQLNN